MAGLFDSRNQAEAGSGPVLAALHLGQQQIARILRHLPQYLGRRRRGDGLADALPQLGLDAGRGARVGPGSGPSCGSALLFGEIKALAI